MAKTRLTNKYFFRIAQDMLRQFRVLRATKVISTTPKHVVVVGIVREKLFGPDTIEEALRVVDSVSSRGETRVLAGINDQEFNLIDKSVNSKNSLKGKFMSPLVVLCRQNGISIDHIGRKLSVTSYRLSNVAFWNPLQFYKTIWLIGSKSWSMVRAPSARKYIDKAIPAFAAAYLQEGSECMALKISEASRICPEEHLVSVVPLENYHEVIDRIDCDFRMKAPAETLVKHEEEGLGLWLPVLIFYIILPVYASVKLFRFVMGTKLTELSNYETQGLALGTWVRDTRRD